MRRGLVVTFVVALSLPCTDLQACGDKFLRAGRSSRMMPYASMYPAAILLSPSPTAKKSVIREWQKMLKEAGHKPQVMAAGADLAAVVRAGRFDLVITDYGTAARARAGVTEATSKPAVLPVLDGSDKALADRAAREFEHVIRIDKMDRRQALAEIDHVLEARSKTFSPATGS